MGLGRTGLGALGCALALWGTGCAGMRAGWDPFRPAPPPQVQTASRVCPDSIPLEEPLEVDYGTPLHARSWLPELTPKALGYQPEAMGLHVHESFRKQLSHASGPVELLGSTHERGVGLVLLSPQAGGYCVINQLLIPNVRLRTAGKKLYFDVRQKRVSHFPLGKDGHFVID